MGLPQIIITFSKKAATLIKRSGRGMLLIILNDNTKQQIISSYKGIEEIEQQDWSEKNYDYLKMAFKGNPAKVVVVRAAVYEEVVNMAETVKLFSSLNFDWLAYPECTAEDAPILVSYIKAARLAGKKVKAVLPNTKADNEGIVNFVMTDISVIWDGETEIKEYNTAEYTVRIAGILSGLSLEVSSTYFELEEIVDLNQLEAPDTAIDEGQLIIIFDGEKYKIGRGVTSLTTVSETVPEDFKKIKIVEGADLIRTDIYSTFNDEFVGKVANTYDNKQAFVSEINNYFIDLYGSVLNGNNENYVEIDTAANEKYLKNNNQNTAEMKEQEIKEGNTGSNLYLSGKISMIDAMEDLQLILRM